MEALGINLGLFILQILAFTIVMLTLNAWVYQPLLNMMATRKQKIEQGLGDARVAAEARLNAEKEAAQILAEAHAEAGKIVREATERAALAAKDVKAALAGLERAAREGSNIMEPSIACAKAAPATRFSSCTALASSPTSCRRPTTR